MRMGREGHMRRREFIALVGGAATSWPLAVRAQQGDRMRRVRFLLGAVPAPEFGSDYLGGGFTQGMRELGYVEGRFRDFRVRVQHFYTNGDSNDCRTFDAMLRRLRIDYNRSCPTRHPAGI